MSKHSLLIALCFVFGTQLCGDPIQTLTITSLTASQMNPPFGSVQFTASGPSVTISASQEVESNPVRFMPGMPIGLVVIGLPSGTAPPIAFFGLLTTTPPGTELQLVPDSSSADISGTTDLLVPPNGNVTFPGTAKGEYVVVECGKFEHPPNCTGPQANIPIDLSGLITLTFSGPGPLGNTLLVRGDFTTVPEPSTRLLLLFSTAAASVGLIARRKKIAQVDQ